MKVLVSWLRELVDVRVASDALGQRLHLAGFELAGIAPAPPPATPSGPVLAGGDPDDVLDFEITANRPDCLSMVGIAREVSTLYDLPLRHTASSLTTPADPAVAGPLRVTIEDAELCPRYTAALVDVTIGPSPAWLVQRLAAAGIRSISNIVDITNYVLLETGHPLHAFDLAKLAGPHLRIRRATPGEQVKTLDGQARTLTPEMLVIADADGAQAVAGVMGGAASEVSSTTTTIVLESAYFHPASIRRTSKRLGLSTEASFRFERGADIEAAPHALARASQLIEEVGAGRVHAPWIDAVAAPREAVCVPLRHARIARMLGFEVAPGEVDRILRGLGFALEPSARLDPDNEADALAWNVIVPSWRVDISREIDLIEEVGRIHGYERIPSSFPPLTTAPPAPNARLARDARMRASARGIGFSEAVTFSFIEREAAEHYAESSALVTIANPLSETFAVMRPSLLPGLVASLAHNRRREQRDVRLFEIANQFTRDRGEHRALALAWTGDATALHWSGTARAADIFDLTGAISALCAVLGLEASFAPRAVAHLTEATASAIEVRRRGVPGDQPRHVGTLGQLAPALADRAGLPAREPVLVAELDLDAVGEWTDLGDHVRAVALPRYPSSGRDLSLLVPLGLPAADIRGTIRDTAPPSLVRIQEFDRYQGRGVPDGQCSVSLRLTFRAGDRTLTEAEVQTAVDSIVSALSERHGATQR